MPIYFLLSLAFDVFLADSWRIEWLVIAVVTYFAAVLIAFLLKSVFVDRIFLKRGTWIANVVIVMIVGSLKNCLVGLMSLNFGLVDSVDWLFRIYGGASLAFSVLFTFVYVLGARIEHSGAMAELSSTRAKLVALRAQAPEMLEAERTALQKQTQSTILPRLDEIQRSLLNNNERVTLIDALRNLVNQQVRPLSESLSEVAAILGTIEVPKTTYQRTNRFFQDRQQLKTLIRPVAMALAMLAGNWMLTYIVLGLDAANWGILYSLATLGIIALVKTLVPQSLTVRPVSGIFLLFLIGFTAANASYWPLKEFSHNFQQDLLLLIVVLNIIGCVIGFAYSKSVDLDRVAAVNQAIRENDVLAREAALFEQQMWIARRNWSFVIHGTVQAALTAAITRLSSGEVLEQYQVDLVKQDLTRAVEALSKTPEPDVNLDSALANLATTWRGICEIKIEITERATRSLQRDANARMCVNEICKEAVSNAVRHGEAKQVTINIDRSEDQLLIIEAADNGLGYYGSPRSGVGSRMLDYLTVSWSLINNRARGLTVLEAKLPLSNISANQL